MRFSLSGSRSPFLPTLCLVILCASRTRAENPRELTALALFDAGRRLMGQRLFAEACPKLAESYQLDPALGTLLNLALCHESEGKTATAYFEYSEARTQAAKLGDLERRDICEQRLVALEPRLSRLVLVRPQHAWVTLDGVPLGSAALASSLPLDPGTHEVRYGARNKRSRTIQVLVSASATPVRVELPALDAESVKTPSLSVSIAPSTAPWRLQLRNASFAASTGALVVGSYFGLNAIGAWNERNRRCSDGTCDREAVLAAERARRYATVADVSFGFALAAASVGVYMIVTSPKRRPSLELSGNVGPTHAALVTQGAF